MEFLQTISLYENIANEYRLNGTTVNSQMLHELTDAGQNLLSSNALSIAIELNNASEELANFEKENNDVEALQGEKKKDLSGITK